MSTSTKPRTRPKHIPYCLSNSKEALAAEAAVNQNFDFRGSSAYATARILYVPYISVLINLNADEFVRSLGGRRHTE